MNSVPRAGAGKEQTMEEFGVVLKRLREAQPKELDPWRGYRRVSQSRLAELAGFDHSYVSRLECGTRQPTRETVDRLISALELWDDDADALLAAAGFVSDRTRALVVDEDLTAAHLLLHDETVPVEYRQMVRATLRSLTEVGRGWVGKAA